MGLSVKKRVSIILASLLLLASSYAVAEHILTKATLGIEFVADDDPDLRFKGYVVGASRCIVTYHNVHGYIGSSCSTSGYEEVREAGKVWFQPIIGQP